MLVVILSRERCIGKGLQNFVILHANRVKNNGKGKMGFSYLINRLVLGNIDGQRDGQIISILCREHPEDVCQKLVLETNLNLRRVNYSK